MMTYGPGVMHMMIGDRAASKSASNSTSVPPHGAAAASSCLLALSTEHLSWYNVETEC